MDTGPTPDAVADLDLRDRAVVVDDALVLADLHLGQGASSRLELPVGAGSEMVERVQTLLDDLAPARLVLAGDVLHSFGTVPHTVRRGLDGILDAARVRDVEIVVLGGNHDAMLADVWDGDVRDSITIDGTVVCHGHVPPDADGAGPDADGAGPDVHGAGLDADDAGLDAGGVVERYVVGHDHPTIEIQGRRRPCYLAGGGVYRGADLVVLPAFSRLPRGVAVNDMTARDFQSPLVRNADALAPIVLDEDSGETLSFPRLGQFRHEL